MKLAGKILYVGHDAPNKYSSSYANNCKVKYFKYFQNAVASAEDVKKLSDCSADGCKHLREYEC